jgi:hypothetical protein
LLELERRSAKRSTLRSPTKDARKSKRVYVSTIGSPIVDHYYLTASEPEHAQEGEAGEDEDPYPLEGKYKDESDRQRYVVLSLEIFDG